MPRNIIGATPFPFSLLDKDGQIVEADVVRTMGPAVSISLCVRAAAGPEKRGGYFFHIEKKARNPPYHLYDFSGNYLASFELPALTRFINHCSGRGFDEESFNLCHTSVNLRQDSDDRDRQP